MAVIAENLVQDASGSTRSYCGISAATPDYGRHRYSADEVRSMIKRQQEKYGWEFLFLGANIDAVETARLYGIREDRSVNFHADHTGVRNSMDSVTEAAMYMRMEKAMPIGWKEKAEADYNSRRKGE